MPGGGVAVGRSVAVAIERMLDDLIDCRPTAEANVALHVARCRLIDAAAYESITNAGGCPLLLGRRTDDKRLIESNVVLKVGIVGRFGQLQNAIWELSNVSGLIPHDYP